MLLHLKICGGHTTAVNYDIFSAGKCCSPFALFICYLLVIFCTKDNLFSEMKQASGKSRL